MMNVTKYLFRIAVAVSAFLIGHTAYGGVRYLMSFFEPRCFTQMAAPAPLRSKPYTKPEEENGNYQLVREYYLFDEALPHGFSEFDFLEVEFTSNPTSSTSVRGIVHMKRDFKFVQVAPFLGKSLSFETEKIDGVSYSFSGDIEREKGMGEFLRGRLVKFKRGVIVASMHAIFYPRGR